MIITPAALAHLAGRTVNANMISTIAGLIKHPAGLDAPHRLAMYLGQLAHESGRWNYDHEIWGPTRAQLRYEGRKDLGNTQPGDGFKFRGRGPIQITGRANYAYFTRWAKAIDPAAPDFTITPDALTTDPWEGLSPIWFWETRGLNSLADNGDVKAITRVINGGVNGLSDRIAMTDAASILLSGYTDARACQRAHYLTADGIIGPLTRGVLHKTLVALPPVAFAA